MNAMVTVCPNCRQQLAVTPADLRVGQGYVRCGRCEKVFNALLSLSEDAPLPTEPASVAHGTSSLPALDTGSMPALTERDELPPLPGREPIIPFGSSDEDDIEVVQTHSTGQYRSLVLEGAQIRPDELSNPNEDQLVRDVARAAASQPLDMLLTDQDREATPPPSQDFDADAAVGNRPQASWGWYAAGVLLGLLLLGQLVHHNRHALVGVPGLDQGLRWVYAKLGETVDPPWDITQYEVLSLGGLELRGGSRTVVLHASVAVSKDAPRGQPPPLIRAELSDRWGNVLARNDLPPRDWLLGEAPARIEPGQRLDAQLSMPAPERVNSFVLAACLPDQSGALQCSVSK